MHYMIYTLLCWYLYTVTITVAVAAVVAVAVVAVVVRRICACVYTCNSSVHLRATPLYIYAHTHMRTHRKRSGKKMFRSSTDGKQQLIKFSSRTNVTLRCVTNKNAPERR